MLARQVLFHCWGMGKGKSSHLLLPPAPWGKVTRGRAPVPLKAGSADTGEVKLPLNLTKWTFASYLILDFLTWQRPLL
jgi:hypothetical protein